MVEVFSVQGGLDAEHALLGEVCGGAREHGLLFWQPCGRALIMPRRTERLEGFAPTSTVVAERGWPVLLCGTDGGPVPQSLGVLSIALSCTLRPGDSEQACIETAYLWLCQPIYNWLCEHGLDTGMGAVADSFCDGRYNITLDGHRLTGTAQHWRCSGVGRPVVLAHAVLLVDAECKRMVEIIDTFTRRCTNAPGHQADGHLGLNEHWSDFRMADSLELERRFITARS